MGGVRRICQLVGLFLFVVGISGVWLLAPSGVAQAQDGPRFGNWGPGMSPPDQDAVDQPSSAAPSTAPSSSGAAAPYAAPAPNAAAPAPAPGIISSSCSYNLEGSWSNQGRRTSGSGYYYYDSYSSTVTLRQYRNWI